MQQIRIFSRKDAKAAKKFEYACALKR